MVQSPADFVLYYEFTKESKSRFAARELETGAMLHYLRGFGAI